MTTLPETPIVKTRHAIPLLLTLAAAASGAAHAQDPIAELPRLLAQAEFERQIFINDGPEAFAFSAGDASGARVVKGAPYCAEAVHETVQWLPDGSGGAPNRITRQTGTKLCRDGEGRTRQEMGNGLVYLRDPTAGESWVLDSSRKTARRLGGPRSARDGSVDATVWREYSERMKDWARTVAERARGGSTTPPPVMPAPPAPPAPAAPVVAPIPPAPPTPVVISRGEGPGRDVRMNVLRMRNEDGREVVSEWAMAPPAIQWRAQSWAPRGAGSVSPLPGKDIDGVRANGERTTWVIEAGKVGNDKPIQITREVWTAPELMITLSSRDFDPRSGEVNYRLKNLKRGEPDAALMRVPADFTRTPRPGSGAASGPTG